MKPSTKHWRKKTPAKHRSYSEKRNRDEKIIQQEDEDFLDDENFDEEDLDSEELDDEDPDDFPTEDVIEIDLEDGEKIIGAAKVESTLPDEIDFPSKYKNEFSHNLPNEIDFPSKYKNDFSHNLPDDILPTPSYDGFHPEQFPCDWTEEDLAKRRK